MIGQHSLPWLIRASALNTAEFFVGGAPASGQRWADWPEVRASDRTLQDPIGNAALLTQPLGENDAVDLVARLAGFFGETGSPWILWSAWSTPDLSAAGLILDGQPPLMLRDPESPVVSIPPGLEIREVLDAEDLRLFHHMLHRGYPIHHPLDDPIEMFAPAALGGSSRFWIGLVNGECVALSAACVSHGVLTVDAVATMPQARRRGYGAAMTDVAARSAPDLPVMLLASDDGRPVYERIGFREIARWTLWHHPGAIRRD